MKETSPKRPHVLLPLIGNAQNRESIDRKLRGSFSGMWGDERGGGVEVKVVRFLFEVIKMF